MTAAEHIAEAELLLHIEANTQQPGLAGDCQLAAVAHALIAVAERVGELVTEQRVVNLVACRSYGLYTASHVGADQIDNRIDEYLTAAFQSEGAEQ